MTRFTEDELDEIKARNPIADVAAGYVKLRRAGGRLMGPCPLCSNDPQSRSATRFEVIEADQAFVCAVCHIGGDVIRLIQLVEGCDFKSAIERLGGSVTLDPKRAEHLAKERERKRLANEKKAVEFREAERKRLWRMWEKMSPIHGTFAEEYLAGRALEIPDHCPGLRASMQPIGYFHGQKIDERTGKPIARMIRSGPVMAGAFIRADGKFGGMHLTYLDAFVARDNPDDKKIMKAEILDPDTGEVLNSKKMRGSKTGAHIAIAMVENPKRLVIGEGIETVLSVWTAMHREGRDISDMAFWAAGDLGNLAGRANRTIKHPTLKRPNGTALSVPDRFPDPDDKGLSIPDSVEELILLGDGDSEQLLTECAMERAARRYARPARVIRIAFAPQGEDFNDVLRSAAAA